MEIRTRVTEAAHAIKGRLQGELDLAILVCFGTDTLAEMLQGALVLPYDQLPGMPTGAAAPGELALGTVHGRQVLLLEGGPDLYKGRTLAEACIPVWVLSQLGLRWLVLINAALGIAEDHAPGDLFVVEDHIDFMGESPLRGHAHEELGPAYPDMSSVYDQRLRQMALEVGMSIGIPVHTGVLAARPGPANETPAELRFLRGIGVDAVATSLVPEAVAARHAGLATLGLSALVDTNPAPHRTPVALEGMIEGAEMAADRLQRFLRELIRRLGKELGR
ncbi:MAG: purine-nucleoside phosphorylase [Planctomycetota bacterium]